MEGDHRRNGVPRQTEDIRRSTMAEHCRFSELHCDLVEKDFNTKLRKYVLDQIVFPHGNAARHDQNVVLQASPDLFAKVIKIISRDSECNGLRTCILDLRADRVAVAVSNLTWFRILVHLNQLVTGCYYGDSRFRGNHHGRFAGSSQQAKVGQSDPVARPKNHVSLARLSTT